MAALTITVAAPPTTNDVCSVVLATMAALSGVLTDYNPGAQIRTFSEAVGAVAETEGISAQATALEQIMFSAMSVFNITPNPASPSVGTVTFGTGTGGPPVTQNVQIPAGTFVQTAGGIQFQTTQTVVLPANSSSILVPVQALVPGAAGNVPAGAITQLITGLVVPLQVSNAAPTVNGADAESPSQAGNRLAAKIASLLLGSPVAVANSAIGVQASGSAETVLYATCYEPWVAAGSGAGSGIAGFNLYIDNGSGAASSGLISAVASNLNGNQAAGLYGFRPAGVPNSVVPVVPTFVVVSVSGSLGPLANQAVVSGAIGAAVPAYFNSLQFGSKAEQPQISAAVANSAIGQLSSLAVTLALATQPTSPLASVQPPPFGRVILQTLNIAVA